MRMIHLRLSPKVEDMIDSVIDGKNLTDKVSNYVHSEFLSKESLLIEKEKCLNKLNLIENALKRNPFHNFNELNEEERKFLLKAKEDIKKNPNFLHGRKEKYNNDFGKHISLKEFKLLMYEINDIK